MNSYLESKHFQVTRKYGFVTMALEELGEQQTIQELYHMYMNVKELYNHELLMKSHR